MRGMSFPWQILILGMFLAVEVAAAQAMIYKDESGVITDSAGVTYALSKAQADGSVLIRVLIIRGKDMPSLEVIKQHGKEYDAVRDRIVALLPKETIVRYKYSASRGFPVFPIRVTEAGLMTLIYHPEVVQIEVKGPAEPE